MNLESVLTPLFFASAPHIDQDSSLGERVKRAPDVPLSVRANSLGKEIHFREVIGRRLDPRYVLLALDPDVDWLNVRPRDKPIFGVKCLGDAIYLGNNVVLSHVPRENISSVFEPILLVGTTSESQARENTVCDLSSTGVDVPGIERKGGSVVGREPQNLEMETRSAFGTGASIACL